MQSKLLRLAQPDPGNPLHEALSEHVVFHSPVRDYHGRADVAHILKTIADVLDKIEPTQEFVTTRQVVTIITATHAQLPMTGVLQETYDALGRVECATLLLRPLSTLLGAIAAMRAALDQAPLPSTLTARVV